ncbi:trypsin-like peptidase domain-containing protein [Micromonospora citrea]|uniref:trypsin-like peptidase domain-containing protein n=1 Tax=Micromonospora citrea TaxID=47855 RepID=UPI003C6B75DB
MALEEHVRRTVKVTGVKYGTGYAVSTELVLTARHVAGRVGDTCVVARAEGDAEHPAVVVWTGDHLGADAALVRVCTSLWDPGEVLTRYGELRGVRPVDCVTVGYPKVRRDSAGRRRVDELFGAVMPTLGFEDGRYAFNSALIPPEPLPPASDGTDEPARPASPYAGHSGAALLTADEQVLIGVMITDPAAYPTGRLEAVRVVTLLADQMFAHLVGSGPEQVEQIPPVVLPSGVLEHDEALLELDRASALRADRLPYVAPDEDDPIHPRRILAELDRRAGETGLLLVGPAGIGKTRTCYEVGQLAVESGWRVLHVKPGEPAVTTDHLVQVLQTGSTDRVLFIVDYLNLSRLDYPAVRYRLLPEARRRNVRVALLASARPGWYHKKDNAPVNQVFTPVGLQPEAGHLHRIRHQIMTTLAPTARAQLGEDRLADLCGTRPVIATLIATEAEVQAVSGRLRQSVESGRLRPEQLLPWLVNRLQEDGLLYAAADLLSDDDPPPALQCYAAMGAAMPQDRASVLRCGALVHGDDVEQAERLLDVLFAMGWAVDTPEGVSMVHDIVVDQLLERTTLRPATNTVRRAVADRILDGSLTRARSIGRYAMNLARLLRDLEDDERVRRLGEHCAAWFDTHATAVGAVLSTGQDEGSYALGSIIDDPAWSPVLFRRWEQVVAPWLALHGRSLPARHLLYKGLRAVRPEQLDELLGVASTWLRRHGTRLEASYVLHPLLSRWDLPPDVREQATTTAATWLDRHGATMDAGYVLHPLLSREDLPPDVQEQATTTAATWLDRHGATMEASYVLDTTLRRAPLTPSLRDAARRWLALHGDRVEASHVISRLLGREEPELAEWSTGIALRWWDRHHDAPVSAFVLGPLIERSPDPEVIAHALQWLQRHGLAPEAGYVLYALLRRAPDPDTHRRGVPYALNWLDRHGALVDAQFVLSAILPHPLDPADTRRATDHARAWLDQHGSTVEAALVINVLLDRAPDPPGRRREIAQGLTWLQQHRTTNATNAAFLLCGLFEHATDAPTLRRVTEHARVWFDHHHTTIDAGFVLPQLLARVPTIAGEPSFVAKVEEWIVAHADRSDVGFVAKHLARQQRLSPAMASAIVDGVIAAPDATDVGWRLTPVAKARLPEHGGPRQEIRTRKLLDREPLLADRMLTAVDRHLAAVTAIPDTFASRPEMYGLVNELCRTVTYLKGIGGARLDDIVLTWVTRPDALVQPCPEGSYYQSLVSRICAILRTGRLEPSAALALVGRLEVWVPTWRIAGDRQQMDDSLADLDHVRRQLSAERASPTRRGDPVRRAPGR